MSKVTSKLQVTIPKAIAQQYGIQPGDDIEFRVAGDSIRVVPPSAPSTKRLSDDERRRLFAAAESRQREREKSMKIAPNPEGRDWKREDLYERGETG